MNWYERMGNVVFYNGEGNGTPLQYSCLENPMDGGAWWAAAHGVVKSWTLLSDFTFTSQFHALEKEVATHSSVLAWRISGTREPGGLPSMGSHRVRHDWNDLAAAAAVSTKNALSHLLLTFTWMCWLWFSLDPSTAALEDRLGDGKMGHCIKIGHQSHLDSFQLQWGSVWEINNG